jgi:hypothetical protein
MLAGYGRESFRGLDECLLDRLALMDIVVHDHDAVRLPGGVANRSAAGMYPAITTVAVVQSVFLVEMLREPVQVVFETQHDR